VSVFRRTLDPGLGEVAPWQPLWVRRVKFVAHVVGWLSRRVYGLCRFLFRHREVLVTVVLIAALWVLMELLRTKARVTGVGLLLVGCCLWSYIQPAVLDGRRPLRSRWRWLTVYRHHWHPVVVMAGLSRPYGGRELLPRILRVRSTDVIDQVHVAMVPGQVVGDFVAKADRLAEGFGAVTCLVQPGKRRRTIVLQLTVPGLRDLPRDGQW
jgi:DNA segregation ATPase FtsK/SpoIIIE, S-DNA-T family